jgi:hypothetical protein
MLRIAGRIMRPDCGLIPRDAAKGPLLGMRVEEFD